MSGLRGYLAGENDGPGGSTRDHDNYDEWVDEVATAPDEFGLPPYRLRDPREFGDD